MRSDGVRAGWRLAVGLVAALCVSLAAPATAQTLVQTEGELVADLQSAFHSLGLSYDANALDVRILGSNRYEIGLVGMDVSALIILADERFQ